MSDKKCDKCFKEARKQANKPNSTKNAMQIYVQLVSEHNH